VHNPFDSKSVIGKAVPQNLWHIAAYSKIMVTLSHCTEGKVFLDPFCGVGNILQEAFVGEAKVNGLDINRWCVDAAKQTLLGSHEYPLKP
jgi:tRNA G10  N-methylase Trm11